MREGGKSYAFGPKASPCNKYLVLVDGLGNKHTMALQVGGGDGLGNKHTMALQVGGLRGGVEADGSAEENP